MLPRAATGSTSKHTSPPASPWSRSSPPRSPPRWGNLPDLLLAGSRTAHHTFFQEGRIFILHCGLVGMSVSPRSQPPVGERAFSFPLPSRAASDNFPPCILLR